MKGTNHIATGILVAAFLPVTPPDAVSWLAVVIGAVVPDIDAGGGLIARPSNFLPSVVKGTWVVKVLDGITTMLSRIIRRVFGHRNFTHWPVIGLGLIFVGWKLKLLWLMFFGIGYVVHILGDAVTKSGAPLFGPFSTKDVRLLPKLLCLKTGSFFESRILPVLLWGYIGVETYKVFLYCC